MAQQSDQANPDGSEDVNDFLVRIRELGDKRDSEDEQRTRKLEEEILQGRQERQAKRAERARSISPTKDSPSLDRDAHLTNSTHSSSIDPPVSLAPASNSPDPDKAIGVMGTKETETLSKKPVGNDNGNRIETGESNFTPSRSSSNHRSTSKELDNTALARTGEQTASSRGKPDNDSSVLSSRREVDTTPSRASITQSLSSKNPSWFRQTSDRGIASPAYRKAQNSETISREANPKLPGLGRESGAESARRSSPNNESEKSHSPSRAGSVHGAGSFADRHSGVPSASVGSLGSPVPLTSGRRFESRASSIDAEPQSTERVAMSPSQGRLATERPSSPTKGLGGFVQSAMLKRSDSVSKRWSAQSGSGSARGPIMPGARGEEGHLQLGQRSPGKSVQEMTHEPSNSHSNSRPGSRDSDAATNSQITGNGADGRGNRGDSNTGFVKPPLPSGATSRSDSITSGGKPGEPPSSPSKTVDSRRWSPTKATWLESALNKPESPKPKSQSTSQVEWKKDASRLKQTNTPVQSPKTNRVDGTTSAGKGSLPDSEHPKSSNDAMASDVTDKLDSGQMRTKKISLETSPHPSTPSNKSSEPTQPAPAVEDESSPDRPPTDGKAMAKDSASRDTTMADTAASKPKAPNPPVKDMRPNLRQHEASTTGSKENNEPEFKNVLGKLRKAETKNYVAPDEFKDNILRGKAALNQTGGPQKSQRVDEFKESILKQRQAMRSGGGSIRRNTAEGQKESPASGSSVPEAIARRNRMNGSESRTNNPSNSDIHAKPSATTSDPKPPSGVDHTEPDVSGPMAIPFSEKPPDITREETMTRTEPLSRPEKPGVKPAVQPRRTEQSSTVSSVDGPKERPSPSTASKGGIAQRLNPELAGILSRGPPGEEKTSPSGSPPKTTSAPESNPTLTHMTKARAKGPKRRLPQGTESDKTKPIPDSSASSKLPPKPTLSKLTLPTQEDEQLPTGTGHSESPAPQTRSSGILEAIRKRTPIEPPVGEQFPFPSVTESRGAQDQNGSPGASPELLPATRYNDPIAPLATTEELSQPQPVSSVAPTAPKTTDRPPTPPKSSNRPSSRSRSPKPDLRQLSTKTSHNGHETAPVVPGSAGGSNKKSPPLPIKKPSFSLNNRSESPQLPPKPKVASDTKPNDLYKVSPQRSPVPRASEASRIFSSFFDAPPKASDKIEIDPQSILNPKSNDDSPKINTLKKQIWEVTGDGRKRELPSNQECTLFEESMYICVHAFEAPNGTKTTQVHLWCGDGVSEAAIEDAQLFARKVARENSSKLEPLKQGKEPFSFIQALGGIIITRRGPSSRAHSSGSYMLCGRRHMGQMSFDEVDFDTTSLCSGYPYIVSGKFGKLYLWQGKGSAIDELGCARLIGMDLGSAAEVEEVTEGEEPQEFFDSFPQTEKPATYHSADYWQLKPNHNKYRNRLFRVDHSQRQRFSAGFWNRRGTPSPTRPNEIVQEIEPFCQRDLEPGHIYILDAFFEIYVIVGEQAHSRSAEVATALVLAQEYSILAVSEQDRPFMPKSSVVLDGIPDECKRAFRKWDDRRSNTCLRKPITVLPLDAAIEAIR